ncbi:MAG: glycosyltransferase [Thermodesulfobacteriota bacterium]
MPAPTVSIIVVTYRNEDSIEACLESIVRQVGLPYEIIMVDNSPDDHTAGKIKQFRQVHPEIELNLIKSGQNLGFAKGCNLGASSARGEYLLFLNPDTILLNDAPSRLAQFLDENPKAAVAGPQITDRQGRITKTCRHRPTLMRIFLDVTYLDLIFGCYRLLRFDHRTARMVDQIIGACIFLRRETFTLLGGFDERFFIYFEEVDFCRRVIESGREVWFLPQAQVAHFHGTSTESQDTVARSIRILRRSRDLYFQKHFGRKQFLISRWLNVFEGLFRGTVFYLLFLARRREIYRRKAEGYWKLISVGREAGDASPEAGHDHHIKVLALTVKPREAPDVRYRILQYVAPFHDQGIEVHHCSLFGRRFFLWHSQGRRLAVQLMLYPFVWVKRLLRILFLAPRYQVVWIGRELSPIGPPILERVLFLVNPNVILDIDDAVFLPDDASTSFIHQRLRDFGKFARLARRYKTIVCGNEYLADYFRPHNPQVEVIPTVVDDRPYQKIKRTISPRLRLGWVGTPTNAPHLALLEEPLRILAQELGFDLLLVGLNQAPPWPFVNLTNLKWELAREYDYFSLFDIGLMPLLNIEFSKGKCAFKLIQYMAAGVPVAASAVGANLEVVRDGENGFLAASTEEWVSKLRRLLTDEELRAEFSRQGRETIVGRYSLSSQLGPYAAIIRGVSHVQVKK